MSFLTSSTQTGPMRAARGVIVFGLAVVGFGFVGMGGWAATANLASGSIASGTVVVSSNRQTVQHLEGGIISEIHVREGVRVEAGDTLVTLDDTRPASTFELIQSQYLSSLGERDRLVAERDGQDEIAFAEPLDGSQGEQVRRGQVNVFESRRAYMSGQRDIVAERQNQLRNEIVALRAQAEAEGTQLELIKNEITDVSDLLEKGLERRPRLLALQRQEAQVEGRRGELLARVAKAEQQIAELDAQLIDLRNERMSEVVARLRETETRIADLAPRLNAARDALERTEITAPRTGFIVDMRVTTEGGVIPPGQPILDIVPSSDTMVVEARFRPEDIDVLYTGLNAMVTLSAYSTRTVPPVEGELVVLSADSLVDQATGIPYYSGRIEVDADELAKLEEVRLVPGMPAEVMIRTGERTVIDYLMEPLQQSMSRAMRE